MQPERSSRTWRERFVELFPYLLLALLLAVQYLAGHPEMFLYTLLLVAGFALARCAWLRVARTLAGVGSSFALAGLLAIGLALPQILLSWEFRLGIRGSLFTALILLTLWVHCSGKSQTPSNWMLIGEPPGRARVLR